MCKQMCQSFLAYFSVWQCENLPELGVMDTKGGLCFTLSPRSQCQTFPDWNVAFPALFLPCVSQFPLLSLALTPFLLLCSF